MAICRSLMATAVALAASLVCAEAQPVIDHAWSRATPGQAQTGVVYLDITSPTDDQLVGLASPAAKSVELHESRMEDGIMRMRAVPLLDIPAGKPVQLAPGGYHAMLMGLVKPLRVAEHFRLVLTFQHAGSVMTDVTVEPVGATKPAMMPDMKMGNGGH